jgi:hypothetical protein
MMVAKPSLGMPRQFGPRSANRIELYLEILFTLSLPSNVNTKLCWPDPGADHLPARRLMSAWAAFRVAWACRTYTVTSEGRWVGGTRAEWSRMTMYSVVVRAVGSRHGPGFFLFIRDWGWITGGGGLVAAALVGGGDSVIVCLPFPRARLA